MEDAGGDANYERQRAMLKALPDATKAVTSALKKVVAVIGDACTAFEGLQRAIEQLHAAGALAASEEAPLPATTAAHCASLGALLATLRRDALPSFASLMQTECIGHVASLDASVRHVEQMRAERKKVVESFESLVKELNEKKTEYEKKGRPLSESKTYAPLAQKVTERAAGHTACTTQFNAEACILEARVIHTAAHVLQCSLEHTSGVCGAMHNALYDVFAATATRSHRTGSRTEAMEYWGSAVAGAGSGTSGPTAVPYLVPAGDPRR